MSGLVTGIISATIGATSAGFSFAQAGKQRRLQEDAEREADKAMQEARKRLEVNYLEAVAIQKEPFELQREQALQASATALEGVREGEARGAAAGVGRVALANQQLTNQQRADMSKELQQLELATANEESRLRDIQTQLDLGEVQGAQQAAADAEQRRNVAMQQGMTSTASALQAGLSTIPLYRQNISQQKTALGQSIGDKRLGESQMQTVEGGLFEGQTIGMLDFNNMTNLGFRNLKRNLTAEQKAGLFGNQAFTDNLAALQAAGVIPIK